MKECLNQKQNLANCNCSDEPLTAPSAILSGRIDE